MAIQFLTNDLTTTFGDTSTDDIIVPAGVIRGSASGGDAIVLGNSSARTLIVDGTVYAEDDGIQLRASNETPDGSVVRIGTTGSVQSLSSGNFDSVAIDLTTITGVTIVNFGLLAGSEAVDGGEAQGDIRITNGGLMEGLFRAIDIGGGVDSSFLSNSGEIRSSQGDGVFVNSGNTTILNSGLISAFDDAVILAGSGEIYNSGTIDAGDSAILGNSSLGTRVIVNSGLISGAVSLGPDADLLANTGTIMGDIDLREGADHLNNNGGVINGTVFGEAGNDTLAGSDNSDNFLGGADDDLLVGRGGNDTLTGDAGADRIIAGDGDDSLTGGTENDTMNGGAGADEVIGGAGNDIVIGGNGDDILEGGGDNDTIDGGAGDDLIEGGDGNDILRGRAGEDQFKPGLGRDVMTGGEAADVFIFATTAIAGIGANRDVIQDFEQGTDIINVAAMAPGAFDFIGTAAFSGTNEEARVIETPAGTSIVEFDADGDGTADAQLKVTGVLGLTADDFAL